MREHRNDEDNPAVSFKLKSYYHHEKSSAHIIRTLLFLPEELTLVQWSCRTVNFFKTQTCEICWASHSWPSHSGWFPHRSRCLESCFLSLNQQETQRVTPHHTSGVLILTMMMELVTVGLWTDQAAIRQAMAERQQHSDTHTHIWSVPHWQAAACTHGPAPSPLTPPLSGGHTPLCEQWITSVVLP